LGVGGCPLGGLYTDMSEEAATATVERALSLGVNLFDTAPLYGAGRSESRLGRALTGRSRATYVVSTKIGFSLVAEDPEANEKIFFPFDNPPPLRPATDYSFEGTMRSYKESRRRLNLDHIDILHIHDPVRSYEEAMMGAYPALQTLRHEGLISAVGAAMNQAEILVRFAHEREFDCFLLAGRYTLLDQSGLKELLPLCVAKGISIIIGGPYNSGILATGALPAAKFNYRDAPSEVIEKVRQIEGVCVRHSVPLKAAALQFPLAHPAVVAVIPGCASASEVEENFHMMSYEIPGDFWSDLRRLELIPPDAPVPDGNR
jgi:D-threo-aldose 1-dehydrogenase